MKLQSDRARTIVLVTHDLREAVKLAEYIVILDQGHLQQKGATTEILSNPANAFVERFVQDQLANEIQVLDK